MDLLETGKVDWKSVENKVTENTKVIAIQRSKGYNEQELSAMWESQRLYEPKMDETKRSQLYRGWKKAVEATRIFKLDDEV